MHISAVALITSGNAPPRPPSSGDSVERDPCRSSTNSPGHLMPAGGPGLSTWLTVHSSHSESLPPSPLLWIPVGATAHVYGNWTCHSNQHLWPPNARDQQPLFSLSVTGLQVRAGLPVAVPRTSQTVMSPGLVLSSDVKQSGQGLPKRQESPELLPLQGQLVRNTSLNCSNTEPCL